MIWAGIGLKYNVAKKLRLDVEHQYRTHHDFKNLRNTFTELAINYKWNRGLSVNGNYRLMFWENGMRHRYALQIEAKKEYESGYSFQFRQRWQKFQWQNTGEPKTDFRSMLSLGKKIADKVKLFVSNEVFFRLNGINQWRAYRFTTGTNLKLNARINALLYYNYQTPINVKSGVSYHMMAVRLFYKLNIK